MAVKRWTSRVCDGVVVLRPSPRGHWVRVEDYEATESRCKELAQKLDGAKLEIDALKHALRKAESHGD